MKKDVLQRRQVEMLLRNRGMWPRRRRGRPPKDGWPELPPPELKDIGPKPADSVLVLETKETVWKCANCSFVSALDSSKEKHIEQTGHLVMLNPVREFRWNKVLKAITVTARA